MKVVVLANESLKEELLGNSDGLHEKVIWTQDLSLLEHTGAEAYIDLLFDKDHIAVLEKLLPKLVIINSVEHTLPETHFSFVRINGWNTFLKSNTIEASAPDDQKKKAEQVFGLFNKTLEWLPDEPGFITPRVVSMIINEAFISLEENVATKENIDTAMKLGTNYPYGPFEWAEKIEIKKIASLLARLSQNNPFYSPSSLMFYQESV